MRAGIGRRINIAIGAGFVLVLVVGGISVLLAWTISAGVEEGRQRQHEVEAINRIHDTVHHFVAHLHLALLGNAAPGHPSPAEILDELKRRIAAYDAFERTQGSDEARQELIRLSQLRALVTELELASGAVLEALGRAQPPTAAEVVAINDLAHERVAGIVEELHAVHQRKVERAIDGTQRRMFLISSLYVMFALSGASLLLLGNRFLSRRLVSPIGRLARAALRVAAGDLSARVPVRSGDEVGHLSQAFNVMTERLEAHEAERLNFQAELERQVKERTSKLEDTAARLQATQAELIRSERIAVTGQIAARVTHEIRTPLNSLTINVHLLRRELSAEAAPPPLGEILAALVGVEYEITRINRTLEEFVNFARLPRPRLEDVEVVPLVGEILGLLGPRAAAAGVGVDSRGATVSPVRADPDQLRQVLLNLAHNAFQAMPTGGSLGLEVGQNGEWVEITVTDSGSGIPEAQQELIFVPFVSTKADGLGLGLPIVRRIVEEHGGTVTCHNRAEGGAAFIVRLPAARSHER
ncbi:MAG: HAMP domain-containing protein [Candidatus Rokubacteria bacterium]|nr:HAMP domain-containing protein [Candidatus Rokubacteria bacterium]